MSKPNIRKPLFQTIARGLLIFVILVISSAADLAAQSILRAVHKSTI